MNAKPPPHCSTFLPFNSATCRIGALPASVLFPSPEESGQAFGDSTALSAPESLSASYQPLSPTISEGVHGNTMSSLGTRLGASTCGISETEVQGRKLVGSGNVKTLLPKL